MLSARGSMLQEFGRSLNMPPVYFPLSAKFPLPAFCLLKSFSWQTLGILFLYSISIAVYPVRAGTPQFLENLKPTRGNSNLNQSQDRIIKKQSFNADSFAVDQPVANREIGLFATVDYERIKDTLWLADFVSEKMMREDAWLTKLLDDSSLAGISCLIPWKDLETAEGDYNWPIIDKLLDYCHQHDKLLILRISTGGLDNAHSIWFDEKILSDTPAWVFSAGAKSLTYKEEDQESHRMPILWDAIYLAKWSNFVQKLGSLYDKNLNLHSVGITGGGTLGGTNILPPFASSKEKRTSVEQELKSKYGMSDRQLISNWKYVADLFSNPFPLPG